MEHKHQLKHFYISKDSIEQFKDFVKQLNTETINITEDYYEDLSYEDLESINNSPYDDFESVENFKNTSLMKNNIWLKKVKYDKSENEFWSVKIIRPDENSVKCYEFKDPTYDNIKTYISSVVKDVKIPELSSLKHITTLKITRTLCKLESGLEFNIDDVKGNYDFKYYILTTSTPDIEDQLNRYVKDIVIYPARSKIVKFMDEINHMLYGELVDDKILPKPHHFFDDYKSDQWQEALLKQYSESMEMFGTK